MILHGEEFPIIFTPIILFKSFLNHINFQSVIQYSFGDLEKYVFFISFSNYYKIFFKYIYIQNTLNFSRNFARNTHKRIIVHTFSGTQSTGF